MTAVERDLHFYPRVEIYSDVKDKFSDTGWYAADNFLDRNLRDLRVTHRQIIVSSSQPITLEGEE